VARVTDNTDTTSMRAETPTEPLASATTWLSGPPLSSIRRRLFWLVGAVVVVTALVLSLILVSLRSQTLVAGERLTHSFAQVLAEESTRIFQAVDQRLELVSGRPWLSGPASQPDPSAGRRLLLEEMRGMPFLRALSVTDADGRVILSSEDGSVGVDLSDRPYFRNHRDHKEKGFEIGPPLRSLSTGSWLITATRPLVSVQGAFQGLMIAALEPTYFERLWRNVDVGPGGSIALFRRDGTLMMRSPFDEASMGRAFPSLPVFKLPLDTTPSGHFLNPSAFDGTYRLFAYQVLPGHPELVLVVGQSYDFVLEPWRRIAVITITMWAIACFIVLILGVSLNNAWLQRSVTEGQVQNLAQRLTLATDAASIGVWDCDLSTGQWSATPTCFAILGYAKREGMGEREQWLELVHPEDRSEMSDVLDAASRRDDALHEREVRLRHADGSYRCIRVVGRVLDRDAKGSPKRLLGVIMDVTPFKQAETAQRASEAFKASILDSVTAEIAVLDSDGVITATNRAWRVFTADYGVETGRPAARTGVGANYLEACASGTPAEANPASDDQGRIARDGIRAVMDRRQSVFRLEYPCHSPSRQRWFAMQVTALGGSSHGVVITHVDISERKLAEETLQESMREKEGLLKEIHHRVKNNLQVITSLLRLETSRSHEPSIRTVLQDMQGRIRSISLLHEMLYRTREFGRVDLGEYLRQLTTQLFRAQSSSSGSVRLTLNLTPVRFAIERAIPCGLIVNELVSNSLKHAFASGGSGEVTLSLQQAPGEMVVIQVSDTGPGLPFDFEARRAQSLGLHLVSDLVRQLGGRFEIAAPKALFTITLKASGGKATSPGGALDSGTESPKGPSVPPPQER
jgi:PAS domain S-box-containing protein